MDRDRARHQLEKGREHLEAGRLRRAVAAFGKGIESMKGGTPDDAKSVAVARELADALHDAAHRSGKPSAWIERLPSLFACGLHKGRSADAYVRAMAVDEKRLDGEALDLYITYLEARGKLPEEVRLRLNQILSFALHIRLTTPIEDARAKAGRLSRLHAARPKLTFPRLYLGRFRYLERDYESARELLSGVSGRLADNPKVLNVRGRCAEKVGEEGEALSLYRKSLESDRHQPHVHFRIGRLLVHRYRHASGMESSLTPTEPQP